MRVLVEWKEASRTLDTDCKRKNMGLGACGRVWPCGRDCGLVDEVVVPWIHGVLWSRICTSHKEWRLAWDLAWTQTSTHPDSDLQNKLGKCSEYSKNASNAKTYGHKRSTIPKNIQKHPKLLERWTRSNRVQRERIRFASFGRKIMIWDVGPESNRVHTSQNFDGKNEKDEVPT